MTIHSLGSSTRGAVSLSVARRFYASSTSNRVGFIGLGQMGYPMASNLLSKLKPSEFIVLDANPSFSEKFVKEHKDAAKATTKLSIGAHPADVASKCSVIVTMLPASPHVKTVYLSENGILSGAQAGSLLLDSSTIDPSTTKDVARQLATKKANVLDTPVSGGTGGAKAGTLTFMVGAESQELFEKAKPYLEKMGKNIVYCGTNGNGQVAKICNNMMLGISMIAASETMNLGVRLGMDPKLLASILNTSSGRSWSTDTYNPCPGVMENVPASRDYEGGFGVSLMAKDMSLAINAANEVKSTTILAGVSHQLYNQLSTTPGFEKKDFSSVFKWLNDNAKKY